MLLYLLRHAHAGDPAAWDGPDAARPLSDKGRDQAERLGPYLAGLGFKPDAIITSPKLRAAQTAEIVADRPGRRGDRRRPPGGVLDLEAVEALMAAADGPERAVLVGHDPDFSDLVADLCDGANVPMRKGTFARIDAIGRSGPVAGPCAG